MKPYVIDETFLKEEVREDFAISAGMKGVWGTQLTVLSAIDEICERHGLRWWADYGTLLGAVRHGGFVPWDDDIDIAMPRADYNRLMQLVPFELPPQMRPWSIRVKEDYCTLSAFIACRERTDTGLDPGEAQITAVYRGCPYVAGVDIYPLDIVPRDVAQRKTWETLFRSVYFAAEQFQNPDPTRHDEVLQTIREIETALEIRLPEDTSCRVRLWHLADELSQAWAADESDLWMWVPELATRKGDRYRPAAAYAETIELAFEGTTLPVPVGYDKILTVEYGDYMAPVQGLALHEYPFYKEQDAYIEAERKRVLADPNGRGDNSAGMGGDHA